MAQWWRIVGLLLGVLASTGTAAVGQDEFLLRPFDARAMTVEEKVLLQTLLAFEGRYNGMVDVPLQSKPGERVRLFVLNAGPSNTSSFHVVGTIFDRVWANSDLTSPPQRGVQTAVVPAGGGAVFSTGSIAWAGAVAWNRYDNDIARMTENVLRRFNDPQPFEMP